MEGFDKDIRFAQLVNYITGSTEQDSIAKAYVHFYTFHGDCSRVLTIFAGDEITSCLQENTIFRNNSMSSRMFKFYSKIVGIPFLFNTLARFIVELNTIADTKAKAAGGNSFLSMEVPQFNQQEIDLA